MPPNKPKLYKNKTPSKPAKNPHQNAPLPSSEPSTSTSNTEIPNQEQFELELCWCIQQLQKGLNSGKLNNKQVLDHSKALNVLMSSTAPIIKKRQVMRLSFGDYREKMADEAKRASKNAANMKFQTGVPNKKTVFLQKSRFTSSAGDTFKFNFNIEEDSTPQESTLTLTNNSELPKTVNGSGKLHYEPSNNAFRFDFQVENENEQ